MKKYLLSLLALSLIPVANATNIAEGNDCAKEGSTCSWAIDENGTLTISGSGYMKNWLVGDYNEQTGERDMLEEVGAPWMDYGPQIKKVKVEEGIKNIGNAAFGYLGLMNSNMEEFEFFTEAVDNGNFKDYAQTHKIEFELPQSLESIGSYSFALMLLSDSIEIPSNVKSVDDLAFYISSFSDITMPANIDTIGYLSFYGVTPDAFDLVMGNIEDMSDISPVSIHCMGSVSKCQENMALGSDEEASGWYSVKAANNEDSKPKRLIYTVQEAAAVVKPTGNTFKIRYR